MSQIIGGSGLGLQYPESLYPANLFPNVPFTAATNRFGLSAGNTQVIPAGRWLVYTGGFAWVQVLDPVSGIWVPYSTYGNIHGPHYIESDGVNYRVANLTGCPVGAIITTVGSGYTAATPPTITVSAGGSTWKAVVGGAVSTVSVVAGGANYTYTPTVYISAPPAGGVQATAVASLAAGAVTSITVKNAGAGYLSAPAVAIIPDPNDPNVTGGTTAITNATAVCSMVTGAGATGVQALVPVTYGTPQTAAVTLTIAAPNTGTQAVASAVMALTITSATISAAGSGFIASSYAQIISAGGLNTSTDAATQPAIGVGLYIPRPANIVAATSTSGLNTTPLVIDGGIFQVAPTPVIVAAAASPAPSVTPTATFSMGSTPSTVTLIQL